MTLSLETNWQTIRATLDQTVSIAWDQCHKIYLLLDEGQHQQMIDYGYDPLIRVSHIGPDVALTILRAWWEESCSLRLVNSVKTVEGNPNDGFTSLILQFEDEDWEDEED